MSPTARERAEEIAAAMDWFDPVFRQELEEEVYAALRTGPKQRSTRTSEWYLVGYEECREAFENTELFSSDWTSDGDNSLGQTSLLPVNADGDLQRMYRRMLNPLFSPKAMEPLQDDIRRYARELASAVAAKESFDFFGDFSTPFPTITFCRLMGFPLADHSRLMAWKDVYMNSTSPYVAAELGIEDVDEQGRPSEEAVRARVAEVTVEIMDYLGALIADRRREPRDDLLSMFVNARRPDGADLTDEETIRLTFNLMLGGLDTVTGMLGWIVQDFARHPARRREFLELMDDEERVTEAIEELVRYHSLAQLPRRVTKACQWSGRALEANDIVEILTPAANRDAGHFADPDETDFDRRPNVHLGFGVGVHRCLGIHLARRELKIGLQEFHRRVPEYHLDPDRPARVGTGAVRTLATLPLIIGPTGEKEL